MVAELLINEIRRFTNISIKALIVSSIPNEKESTIKKIPVIPVWKADNNLPVIIATLADSHLTIASKLEEYSFSKVMAVSEKMFCDIRLHFVPESHDIAAIKIKISEMKKQSTSEFQNVGIITDSPLVSAEQSWKRYSSVEFINSENIHDEIYVLNVNWDSDWRGFFRQLFGKANSIHLSYRYKYLKDSEFSLVKYAKSVDYQLSGLKKIYRAKKDYYTEDVVLFFEKRTINTLCRDRLCTGCGVCVENCPARALTMKRDDSGDYKPQCNRELCIECGKCLNICPVYKARNNKNDAPDCYLVQADDETRFSSSSGGVFSLLARSFLKNDGIVVGAAWESTTSVKHILIDREEDLYKLQKSKYLRSDTTLVFKQIKEQLDEGRKVMFVGCPCQVAALLALVGKHHNLFVIDLICAQAPNNSLFEKYIFENYENSIVKYEFRDKRRGWRPDSISITFDDGTQELLGFEDKYQSAYHNRMMMPVSCEFCPYIEFPRIGDISIGDAWGIDDFAPELNDGRGLSTVIINTQNGRTYFEDIESNAELVKKIPFSWTSSNRTYDKIVPHPYRERFYDEFKRFGFNKAVDDIEQGMFDIGLVGNWSYPNYGSELTYFALYRTLKELGKSVLMIEWAEDCIWKPYGYPVLFKNNPYACYEIARPITNHASFYELNKKCRMFIQGSDQLLHPYLYEVFGRNVILDWVDINKKKIGYALSFGHESVEYEENDQRDIAYQLSLFDAVSVREKSAVALMNKLFERDSVQVLDPVFLQDKAFYEHIAHKYLKYEQTLFSYVLDPTVEEIHYINLYAKKMGLKTNMVSDAAKLDANNKECEKRLSVEEWIASIINAQFVITDSFHGMCIAIICNKNFIAICNDNRGATRFESILQLIGLENRLIKDTSQLNEMSRYLKPIDYRNINAKLSEEKEKSINWLESAINEDHKSKVSREAEYYHNRLKELEIATLKRNW